MRHAKLHLIAKVVRVIVMQAAETEKMELTAVQMHVSIQSWLHTHTYTPAHQQYHKLQKHIMYD